jgi:hypothetical protein
VTRAPKSGTASGASRRQLDVAVRAVVLFAEVAVTAIRKRVL